MKIELLGKNIIRKSIAFSAKRFQKALFILLVVALTNNSYSQTGTWSVLTNTSPNYNMGVMLVLTDGTILCHATVDYSSVGFVWDHLTPDNTGSYINGTWTTTSSMANDRLFFPSQVLPNGQVFVAGGEYGAGSTFGEVYDPVADVWTATNPVTGGDNIFDGNSEILYNGKVLVGVQNGPHPSYDNLFYTPSSNSWSLAASNVNPYNHDEAAWLKLPDSSILFVGINSTSSCRYIPRTNTWVVDGTVPVHLFDQYGSESGAASMLPNGKAVFFGARGLNAIYTPSGNTSPGTWTTAASFPIVGGNQMGTVDASIAMMPNGKILCAASPVGIGSSQSQEFRAPTYFFEYDYVSNTFTQVTGTIPVFGADSLDGINCDFVTFGLLPNGDVLMGINQTSSSYIYFEYTPVGSPIAQGKPVINSIYQTACGSNYYITGKVFNGISEGAAFGDDWQMSTNYPLVRLTDGTNIYYAKTTNWNRIGAVQTDSLKDTAQFALPAALPAGTYSLSVVVNGFASSPTSFSTYQLSDSIMANVSCHGGSNGEAKAIVLGGNLPYTYKWTNASSTVSTSNPSGAVLTAGTYTLTVKDKIGCTLTASFTITQPTALSNSVNVTAEVSCNGGNNGSISSTVTGGTTPYTYSWSNSATTTSISALTAGGYTLTVHDNNGCSATASATITQPLVLAVTASVTTEESCNGDNNGALSSSPSGGTTPYTYLWSGGGTNSTKTNATAGSYTITVTDKNGCTASASATITQPVVLTASTSITQAACATSNGSASASPSGGTGAYTYAWAPGASTQQTVNGLSAHIYTVTVTDANGCNVTATADVTNTGNLAVTASSTDENCHGQNIGTTTAHPSGGTTPYTYAWSPSGGNGVTANALTAGTYSITLTDANGCIATASAVVTQPNALSVVTGSHPASPGGVCNGSAWATVTGGTIPYTYLWTPGSGITDTIKSLCIGNYCCKVTDKNGCVDSACVNVITGIQVVGGTSSSIKVYPDPNMGYFNVSGLSKGQIVEVYNYIGEKISTTIVTGEIQQFNIADKANGLYLIRILSKDGSLVAETKIIKAN